MTQEGLMSRRRPSQTALIAAMLALAPASVALGAHGSDDKTVAWVPGTERLPPPPTGREADRLALLNPQEPVDEQSGDISAAVTVHSVFFRAAADDEWRAFYGGNWLTEARSRVEAADNAMYSQFGIDFVYHSSFIYDSAPDTTRAICNSSNDLLDELVAKVPRGSADVVAGFTNNAATGVGCAVGNHTLMKLHGSTTAQRVANVWKTAQHEFSHLFGAPDRYPDPGNFHTNDVMENQYANADYWCTQTHYEDWSFLWANRGKYD